MLLPGLLVSSIAAGIAPATVAAAAARHGRRVHCGQLLPSFLRPSRPHLCLPQLALHLPSPSSSRHGHRSTAYSISRPHACCKRCTHAWPGGRGTPPGKLRPPADTHEPRDASPPLPRCRRASTGRNRASPAPPLLRNRDQGLRARIEAFPGV
jgi:hypothetical protein